jgi:hypothetical protein
MASDLADIAERLSAIGEELADVAIDRLRQASETVRSGGDPDSRLMAEEKLVTRARRSVERAALLLAGPAGATHTADEGP